ncbi:MAG: DUF115 domain-containing protein [Verrucomicrobiales bacterium]|nr:DUF115 domain-containing protein [Verrucomicrobiales bacterium]
MRPDVNPYRHGAKLIFDRFVWDLHPESWRSRSRLKREKGSRSGRALILCNGPSLNEVDFEALENSGVFTIGLNKINLLFERSSFRPDMIVAVNGHVIKQNAKFFRETDIPLYLSSRGQRDIGSREHVTYLHHSAQQKFACDCSWSIPMGYTVTYVAMQLAYHLGFEEIGLVGCDHNFASKGRPNEAVKAGDSDPNHFDPRYFSQGVTWQLPDLIGSEHYYNLARLAWEENGRRIVNCTAGGKLEIFPRETMEEFLLKS